MLKRRYTLRKLIVAFWAKVEKCPGSSTCWEWRAATVISRNLVYGQFRSTFFGSEALAHRVSWMLSKRKLIPKGKQVCHSCDNPICVRPSHLFLGTQQDNEDDKKSKGRTARGDRSPRRLHPESYRHFATLNEQDVLSIRKNFRRHVRGEAQRYAILYGVCQGTIYSIVADRHWKGI